MTNSTFASSKKKTKNIFATCLGGASKSSTSVLYGGTHNGGGGGNSRRREFRPQFHQFSEHGRSIARSSCAGRARHRRRPRCGHSGRCFTSHRGNIDGSVTILCRSFS